LIFAALATLGVPGHPRFQWIGATLFCWILASMWPLVK
jgi:hypothetical protein